MKRPRKQKPWMRTIRIGDVLEDCNGTQRVVRSVSRYKDGDLRSVTFTIRGCSWTGRCYTVLTFTDLNYRGFRPTGVRRRMGSALDWKIHQEIRRNGRPRMGCCDVRGIA